MKIKPNRTWGWADWFVIGIRFIGFIISLVYFSSNTGVAQLGFVIAFGLFAYAVPQLFYLPVYFRPRIFIGAELLLSIAYMLYITSSISNELNVASYFYMPLFVISYLSTKKLFLFLVPLCCVCFPIFFEIVGGYDVSYLINQAINSAFFSAFGFSFGVFLRQKNQLAESIAVIEEKNKELEHYISQVEKITLLEERNRMSRELHDTVGHSLTASIMAMEAIQTLMEREPKAAKKRLTDIIDFSRNHLNRIRQTVHEMAMNELKLPLEDLLRQTAEEFAQQTGTKVTTEFRNKNTYTSEAVKLAFLRCLQEALTNAKKHGNASEINTVLKDDNGQLVLQVQDNGSGSDFFQNGYGIEGMKQRMQSLRGTFQISSNSDSGMKIVCKIPMEG